MGQTAHHDDVGYRERKHHVCFLRDKCNALREIPGLDTRQVLAAKLDSTPITANQAAHDLEQRDFPAPLGPTNATNSLAVNVVVTLLRTSADVYPKERLSSSMTMPYRRLAGAEQRFYLKRISLSNRIRHMPENRERWLFALTIASAAAALVSIAAAETLLVIACLTWIVIRPGTFVWPSYFIPLGALLATTVLSLIMSPQPVSGRAVIYKFWLFMMGLLAANCVNTPERARKSQAILLSVAAVTSLYALFQFVVKYRQFLQSSGDDPTVNFRITGFMGHWITFSG